MRTASGLAITGFIQQRKIFVVLIKMNLSLIFKVSNYRQTVLDKPKILIEKVVGSNATTDDRMIADGRK